MADLTLSVPDMSCGHCVASISEAVDGVAGVRGVDVDLEAKRVDVRGNGVDRAAVVAAIRGAGYEPVVG